jgi:nucleotide-binding universal stress UspA family protein
MALIQPTRPGIATGGGDVRRILVPVDPDGYAGAALAEAVSLATAVNGHVRVVHVRVFDPPLRSCGKYYPESSEQATEILAESVATAWAGGARASGVVVEAQRTQVGQTIAAYAREWNAGVIVMAHRPRRVLTKLFCGSVGDLVMRQVTCPVLAVHPR